MEFEVGNLFYIVITIVAIIVGILGKKKKPAGQGTGKPGSESRPGFFENLEKAFNMGQEDQMVVDLEDHEEDIPVEEKVEVPTSTLSSEAGGLIEEYERMLASRMEEIPGGSVLTETDMSTEPLEVIDLDNEGGTNYFEVVKDFDAGTAVVYSAIINRVEY